MSSPPTPTPLDSLLLAAATLATPCDSPDYTALSRSPNWSEAASSLSEPTQQQHQDQLHQLQQQPQRINKRKYPIVQAAASAKASPALCLQDPSLQSAGVEIVQNPVLARVSGITTSDKRPIHPPPIVRLTGCGVRNGVSVVCMVSLWSSDLSQNLSHYARNSCEPPLEYLKISNTTTTTGQDEPPSSKRAKFNVVPTESYSRSQTLLGTLISTPESLLNLENNRGLYFLFPDLAVRISGQYRLKFDLFDITQMAFGAKPLASASSDVFKVYNPKEFPGTVVATPLSRCFASQGMRIRLRQATNGSHESE
ncbi:velvet factor-domain-containing protein [Obelidium mucronatum]|nr:velvet factor-domain-containing protein [Obelidium mucronatum]